MKSSRPQPLAPSSLEDKVILIIGATGCIGQEVAKTLCEQNAQVILVSKQIKRLEKLYDHLETLGKHEPALHAMNLMNIGIDDCLALKTHIENLFSRLDGIIFCSGKWGELTPIEHYKESDWLELMHLNLNVPFLVTKHLIPLLKKTKNSTVIYSESPLSSGSKAYHGAFNCAQSGLRTMIELLDQENSYLSIRFMGLNPECVNSSIRRRLYPADPNPENGLEAKDLAPISASLLTQAGEAYKGKTAHAKVLLVPSCEL